MLPQKQQAAEAAALPCCSADAQPGLQAARRRRATSPARWRVMAERAPAPQRTATGRERSASAGDARAVRAATQEARVKDEGAGRLVVLHIDAR